MLLVVLFFVVGILFGVSNVLVGDVLLVYFLVLVNFIF